MPREKRVQSNRPSKNALSTVESDMLPSPERVAELDIEEGSALRSQSEQYRSQSKQQSSHLNKTSNGTITERVKVTEEVKEVTAKGASVLQTADNNPLIGSSIHVAGA